jgi:hypothetical protein
MNSSWGNLYDWCKDRRYAALFLAALGGFFGLIILGAILYLLNVHFVDVLPGIGLFIAALVWKVIRRVRAQHRNPSTFSPLSRDDWRKARSKLVKDQNFKKL